MRRVIVSTLAVALLAFASGTATAEATSKSAFPKQEDPWQQWGKPNPKPQVIYVPQPYYVPQYYVWVPAQWWWDGSQWVLVPGYWRAW